MQTSRNEKSLSAANDQAHINAHQARTAPVLASSDLADLQRLSMKDLRALVGRSESSIRDLIAAGRFPQPDYRDGPRCVRWSAGSVRRWLESTSIKA
ncbi:MAG: helix-turn-helix transcriptional regulator [Leptothrix sp. (in: b-proteobacteria)]